MTKDELVVLKNYLPIYLKDKGINLNKLFRCLSPYHEDKHPSMIYYDDKKVCHCFACGVNLDLFSIIGYDYNLVKFTDQANKIREIYNIDNKDYKLKDKNKITKSNRIKNYYAALKEKKDESIENKNLIDYSSYLSKCSERLSKLSNFDDVTLSKLKDFLDRRCITLKTAEHFNCGYDPLWISPKVNDNKDVPYSPRFIIPSSQYGYLARDIRDRKSLNDIQIRTEKMKTGKMDLFNKEALNNKKRICFITEGEIDTMSIYQEEFESIALGSTSMINSFFQALDKNGTNSILVPLLDNDSGGKTATIKLEEGLKERNVKFYHVDNFCLNAKDPNEALCKNPNYFKAWIRYIALSAWYKYETKNYENSIIYKLTRSCLNHSLKNNTTIYQVKNNQAKNPSLIYITKTDEKSNSIFFFNYKNRKLNFIYGLKNDFTIDSKQENIQSMPQDIKNILGNNVFIKSIYKQNVI